MKQYNVTGMSCAACSARVEKAVSAVEGVTSCSVSLLTNSMGVEGTADEKAVIKAVENAGYGASLKGAKTSSANNARQEEEALEDKETPVLKKRLIVSLGFLLVLMYVSMGIHMFGFPAPSFLKHNPLGIGVVEMLLAGIVMVINQKFFINGFRSLFHLSPNMDTLVAMGSSVSFLYSFIVLMLMTTHAGEPEVLHDLMKEFYFESAAMIVTLITVGKMLEARAKGKTTDALKSLIKLSPQEATVLRDGQEVTVAIDDVVSGDIFLVKPGDSIPVDGVVLEGSSSVNESALTGESIPVDKSSGDTVSAATINQSGYLKCRATRVGENTTLSQIIQLVSDAAATKAPIAKTADTISGYFVPAVLAIAAVTTIVWLLLGRDIGFALARGISVLVISCPCALGLATPVAIMVGNGIGAKNGILFKTAASLEATGKTEIIAMDKTGTLTKGEPEVTDILSAGSDNDLLIKAASLEKKSEHPLARAILKKAEEDGLTLQECEDFTALSGSGIRGTYNGKQLLGGSYSYISSQTKLPEEAVKAYERFASEGKTPVFFLEDGEYLGMIAIADTLKEDSIEAVKQLRGMGIRTVMLTGDNKRTAEAIAKLVGVDQVISEVLPGDKEAVIRSLQKDGKTAMVGDGINDAPALTRADIGMAIGAGADVAIDAADIVLRKNSLLDVPAAIRLSRYTLRNIHENLFWAFIYNAIGIPLAAGLFIRFGLKLNPMFGAAAMSLSSFCVVTNALRLNLKNIYDSRHDKKINVSHKEEKKMTKELKIEGMMCEHCEATVKKALEAVDGVASAAVSHKEGNAVVELTKDVDNAVLKKAVEDKDYNVTAIQ
ncbi:MAG: heavy metal translocating P-type ATPase [Erysipelotrichaceae bacterium]|nr:heavy metal translocating P-type ATPase [Erysipelotrichaceae bacterium]